MSNLYSTPLKPKRQRGRVVSSRGKIETTETKKGPRVKEEEVNESYGEENKSRY